jgi:hypothetical protein
MRLFRASTTFDHLPQEDLMSDPMSFAELDEQHVELLPARTVLSMFSAADGGVGSSGADATGTPSVTVANLPLIPGNSNATGGAGADANG